MQTHTVFLFFNKIVTTWVVLIFCQTSKPFGGLGRSDEFATHSDNMGRQGSEFSGRRNITQTYSCSFNPCMNASTYCQIYRILFDFHNNIINKASNKFQNENIILLNYNITICYIIRLISSWEFSNNEFIFLLLWTYSTIYTPHSKVTCLPLIVSSPQMQITLVSLQPTHKSFAFY